MEQQNMQGGVIAIKCTEQQDRGWLNTIPPLGTVNEDLKLTSETDTTSCVAGNLKKTQAYRGRFERFVGKVGLSGGIDQESSDNNDVETGRDKVKGFENITLSLDMTRENSKARLEGAVQGAWDYAGHAYYNHPSFRDYQLIIAFGPNVQNLHMASAEMLHVYDGLRIERVESEFGNPNKFKLSLFARRAIKIPNWAQLTPQAMMGVAGTTVVASTSYSAALQPNSPSATVPSKIWHSRLKCTFTGVTAGGPFTITGTNFFGEDIEETITLTGTGTIEYITKNYFNTINTAGITLGAGWTTGTTLKLLMEEYDCKILP
jgi:hypothetical protein